MNIKTWNLKWYKERIRKKESIKGIYSIWKQEKYFNYNLFFREKKSNKTKIKLEKNKKNYKTLFWFCSFEIAFLLLFKKDKILTQWKNEYIYV